MAIESSEKEERITVFWINIFYEHFPATDSATFSFCHSASYEKKRPPIRPLNVHNISKLEDSDILKYICGKTDDAFGMNRWSVCTKRMMHLHWTDDTFFVNVFNHFFFWIHNHIVYIFARSIKRFHFYQISIIPQIYAHLCALRW